MADDSFRVVIVGGGPVGLCLARALTLAKIDYVLLEKRDTVVEDTGFGLALWPHGVRVLDQLGLLEEGLRIRFPMKDKYNVRPDGSDIVNTNLYERIEQQHGHPWMLFLRKELLELLYKDLPGKETRVLTNKKVVSIDTLADGVQVHCDDSSVEKGSIVVGCDGVYSGVRGIMRDLQLKASGHVRGSETPMKAEYQALVGYLNRIPQMQTGTIWEVRGQKTSFQVFMQEDVGWFLAYKRLSEPVCQSTQYSDDDVTAFADSIMDHPVGEGLLFRDLWDVRKWTRMLNIEEGLVSEWHHDRIVLLGDSIHKMSPNAGLGMNQGWQGVVALTNLLRKLLSENPAPDTATLTATFDKYKKMCQKSAKDAAFLSNLYLRTTCWHNVAYKVADILGPYLGGDPAIFRLMASPMIKKGLVLDWIPETGHREGSIPWDNKPYVAEQ